MVRGLSLMSSSTFVSTGLVSASGVGLSGALGGVTNGAAGGAVSGTATALSKVASSSTGRQGTMEEFTHEQAVEVTERKTVLIRTVKTEENNVQSDTQERTITISGAADETEE